MAIKEITVVGLGGVGGYFGFKLAKAFSKNKDVAVSFIARASTYQQVKKDGLTLLSPEHPEPTIRPDFLLQNIDELRQVDVVLICVKEYDLENVCLQLKEKVSEDTVILPLMNGVDIYDRIRTMLPETIILPACVYVASHIKAKGVVEHKGKPGKIVFGKDPQHPHHSPGALIEILTEAEIQFDFKEDAFQDIWKKFIFIASFGLVTARYNLPIGVVNEKKELRDIAESIMLEIKAIAARKGVGLPDNVVDLTFQKASTFPYHTPTSLQLDIHSPKPNNELELFAGAIFRYGEEVEVPTLRTRKIYDEIKKYCVNNKKAAWKF